MTETTIKARFFRDWVWVWLIFLLIMGIPALIFSIVWFFCVLIYINQIVIVKIILILVSLSLVIMAWSFFFGFLYALKKKIVFSKNYIEYSYPAYNLFGTKIFRIQKKDIHAVALGFFAMWRLFPEEMKSKTTSMIPASLFIELGYVKDGEMLLVQLPKFNNPQYFSEIKRLIKDTKLKKTELAFIFKK
jgi:hypothetical protein